jgi:hypothetical protein
MNKTKQMILNALEFFIDYRFNTGTWMQSEYLKKIQEIDHNDYTVLCKNMGGKTRFQPTVSNESPANDFSRNKAYIEHRKEYPYYPDKKNA